MLLQQVVLGFLNKKMAIASLNHVLKDLLYMINLRLGD